MSITSETLARRGGGGALLVQLSPDLDAHEGGNMKDSSHIPAQRSVRQE